MCGIERLTGVKLRSAEELLSHGGLGINVKKCLCDGAIMSIMYHCMGRDMGYE